MEIPGQELQQTVGYTGFKLEGKVQPRGKGTSASTSPRSNKRGCFRSSREKPEVRRGQWREFGKLPTYTGGRTHWRERRGVGRKTEL